MGDGGIEGFAVRDTPRFAVDMFACTTGPVSATIGAAPRSSSLADSSPSEALAGPDIRLIDLTPWICPGDVCAGVIGNVAVYRDDNHLSRTYATTLAPLLSEQLPARLG